MHCVGTTRKALEAVPGVFAADVAIDSAKVYGDADPQALIAAVEDAGYHAGVSGRRRPKTEPLTDATPSLPDVQPAAQSPSGNRRRGRQRTAAAQRHDLRQLRQ